MTVIEGTTQNLQFVDMLPAGTSYVAGSAAVSNANGMTVNGLSAISSGNKITITATSVVNPGKVNNASTVDSDSFSLQYQTRIDNVSGNQLGIFAHQLGQWQRQRSDSR